MGEAADDIGAELGGEVHEGEDVGLGFLKQAGEFPLVNR